MSDRKADLVSRAVSRRRFKLGRRQRLRTPADFQRVLRRRATAQDTLLRVSVCENGESFARLGISVSRRIGSAVQRNRQKRRLREAFRNIQHDIPAVDIVCQVRCAEASVTQYSVSLARLIPQAIATLNRQTRTSRRQKR